ncbi:MAG: hypothetical protein AAF660_14255 [Pseudomonadota bacterium]
MSDEANKQVLRLQRRHEPDPEPPPDTEIGRRLLAAQSVRAAIVAGFVVILGFSLLWVLLSQALDKVFPWFVLVLGPAMGMAVRRAGCGLDWRFPVLAAVLVLIAALAGNIAVAIAFAGSDLGGSVFVVLPTFTPAGLVDYVAATMTPADIVIAGFSGVIAAFYAMRRLNRRQYLALRLYRQDLSKQT